MLFALGALLVVFRLVSELVGTTSFMEDLRKFLAWIKPVTDFFTRQPEWAFYPICIAMILLGVAAAAANWAPLVMAMVASRGEVSETNTPQPEDAARAAFPSKWSPDMTMDDLVRHLANKTTMSPRYGMNENGISAEIHTALYSGKIIAWGKLHPSSEEFEISTRHWNHAELSRLDGSALLKLLRMPIYELRFARGQVEATWPPRG